MTRSQYLVAAGRRAAPAAAVLLAVVAASSALAHGPITKKFREPPPGTAVPVTPPVTAADLGPPAAPAAPAPRPLRLLAADATAVLTAEVVRTEVFDEGRLHVHRLHAVRVLQGRLDDPEPGVVDIRGDANAPALLNDGEQVVVFLRPAPSYSYLTEHLPAGMTALSAVSGRDGGVPVTNAEREVVERTVAEGAAVARLPEAEAEAVAARRRLAFSELAATHPRLLADGVAELRLLPALTPLSSAESAAIATVLRERARDPQARIALIGLIAERGALECLPALAAASADTPAVLDALLTARTRLGAPPTCAELAPLLGGDDPAVRAAAVRALARLADPAALADVGHYATADKDAAVRGAAVDALGESHQTSVLPVLQHSFADPSRDVMQRSARALIAIGGRAADATLTDMALKGPSTEVRTYATLILVMTHGRNDPVVQELAASNPGPEVREVLDHPLEFHHTHIHD